MTDAQKHIVKVLRDLPDEISRDDFDAMICSLISAYIGQESVPEYLLYLGARTAVAMARTMDEAEEETKH